MRSVTQSDMREAMARVFHPGNLVISVTGERGRNTPTAADSYSMPHGLYHAEKDIPQGKVFIGRRSVRRDDPDLVSIELMNEILGGGGFTSRITKRVRSAEALAYSAGTGFGADPFTAGGFRAVVQSKNRTVALSLKLILEEFAGMQSTLVSDEELETTKKSFIESFPERFSSRDAMMGIFVDDEWTSVDG